MSSLFFPSDLRSLVPSAQQGNQRLGIGDLSSLVPSPVLFTSTSCASGSFEDCKSRVIDLQQTMQERLAYIAQIQSSLEMHENVELVEHYVRCMAVLKVAQIAAAYLSGEYLMEEGGSVDEVLQDLSDVERSIPKAWHKSIQSLRQAICEQGSDRGAEARRIISSLKLRLNASKTPIGRENLERQFFELQGNRRKRRQADSEGVAIELRVALPGGKQIGQVVREVLKLYEEKKYTEVCDKLCALSTTFQASEEEQTRWACYELGWALHLLGCAYLKRAMQEESSEKLDLAEKVFWEALWLKDANGLSVIHDFEVPTLAQIACVHLFRASIGDTPAKDEDCAIDLICLCGGSLYLEDQKSVSSQAEGSDQFDLADHIDQFIADIKRRQPDGKGADGLILAAARRCTLMSQVWKWRADELSPEAEEGPMPCSMPGHQASFEKSEKQIQKKQQLEDVSFCTQSAALAFFTSQWKRSRLADKPQLNEQGLPLNYYVELHIGMTLLNLEGYGRSENGALTFGKLVKEVESYSFNLGLLLKFLEGSRHRKFDKDFFAPHTLDIYRALTGLSKDAEITPEHVQANWSTIKEFHANLRLECSPASALFSCNFVYTLEKYFSIKA